MLKVLLYNCIGIKMNKIWAGFIIIYLILFIILFYFCTKKDMKVAALSWAPNSFEALGIASTGPNGEVGLAPTT